MMDDALRRYPVMDTKRARAHNSLYGHDNTRYKVVVRYGVFDDYGRAALAADYIFKRKSVSTFLFVVSFVELLSCNALLIWLL